MEDENLTKICMNLSISSFAKEWDNEDDDYWNQYIYNDKH